MQYTVLDDLYGQVVHEEKASGPRRLDPQELV
jgi:hypothetical protein